VRNSQAIYAVGAGKYSAICVEHLGVIAAETLTHRDGPGGELVAQSWNAQWAAIPR